MVADTPISTTNEAHQVSWPRNLPWPTSSRVLFAVSSNPGIPRHAQTGDIFSAQTPPTNSRVILSRYTSSSTDTRIVLLPPRTAQVYAYLLSQEKYELERGTSASWERLLHLRHLKERLLSSCSRSDHSLISTNPREMQPTIASQYSTPNYRRRVSNHPRPTRLYSKG